MDVQPTLFLLQYLAMTDWHTESLHKATIDFASNSRFTTDDFTSHPFIHILLLIFNTSDRITSYNY